MNLVLITLFLREESANERVESALELFVHDRHHPDVIVVDQVDLAQVQWHRQMAVFIGKEEVSERHVVDDIRLLEAEILVMDLLVILLPESKVSKYRLNVTVHNGEVLVLKVDRHIFGHALSEELHTVALSLNELELDLVLNVISDVLPLITTADLVKVAKVELHLEEEVRIQIFRLYLQLGAEKHDIVDLDLLFAIADEEHL